MIVERAVVSQMPYKFWRVMEMCSIFTKQWILNNLILTKVKWYKLLINISYDHKMARKPAALYKENPTIICPELTYSIVQN